MRPGRARDASRVFEPVNTGERGLTRADAAQVTGNRHAEPMRFVRNGAQKLNRNLLMNLHGNRTMLIKYAHRKTPHLRTL